MFLKSQISLFEFLIVSVVALILLIFTFLIQIQKEKEIYNTFIIYSIQNNLNKISTFLNFEGIPKYWSCENFTRIGFLNDEYLNLTKLSFLNSCYEKIRIREEIENEFCISLTSFQINYSYGNCNFSEATIIMNQKRIVPLKINFSEAAIVKIIVWKK